jgi:hypothetical protein
MHAAAGAGVPVTYISVDSSRSERSDASCRENSLSGKTKTQLRRGKEDDGGERRKL